VRIFLSYGHDEYVSLASRVKRDLEARGHEVWFDVERLKAGGDWERYIEEGFEGVSKDSESGHFLLLMTPHSVRRPCPWRIGTVSRFNAMSHCYTEAKQQFASHRQQLIGTDANSTGRGSGRAYSAMRPLRW
jgi:hypothetical protein